MSESRESGIAGVDLTPGDHVCAMFFGQQERDEIVVPYLEAGLRAGDKCVCIVESPPIGSLAARMGSEREVEGYLASEQLELRQPADVYLRTVPFSSEKMIRWWESNLGTTTETGGYDFGRATGEMPPAWQTIDRAEWFRYEADLNQFLLLYPQFIVCLYDLDRFGSRFTIDLLRTHPKLLIGGLLLENPHWVPPADLVPPPA